MSRQIDDESLLHRPLAASSYEPNGRVLRVPKAAIERTAQCLTRFGRFESCCFWFGERDSSGSATVRAVLAPRQRGTWGNYHVAAAAMIELADIAEPQGWTNVAQVHSHPGRYVEHSLYDDQMASSRRALSLVFPNYGVWSDAFPTGIGVHEFQSGYWHLLNPSNSARRLQLDLEGTVLFKDLR